MKPQEKILLPSEGETAAITLKPKTAALYFDRVWATSEISWVYKVKELFGK
jgi:hypothetical protein